MAAERATASGGRRVGERIADRYRFVRVIGQGGMGEVYEAEDRLLGRRVAIKCLWPELARDAEQVQRFQREARAASVVASAHVADVLETGMLLDGAPFLVMELLAGETLAAALAVVPAFPVGRAASIARQIASGLSAAHGAGIVHRDMKPENVFLVPRAGGRELVKILDFGVSKFRTLDIDDGLTRTGTAIGTPAYMSPEQSGGARDVDHRTDVWALGVILHRMLAGELPFTAENYARLLLRIVSEPAPLVCDRRPDVPAALEAVIVRCLAKRPEDRFATMAEVAASLTQFERSTAKLELSPSFARAPSAGTDAPTRVAATPGTLLERGTPKSAAKSGAAPRDALGSAPTAFAGPERAQPPAATPATPGASARLETPAPAGSSTPAPQATQLPPGQAPMPWSLGVQAVPTRRERDASRPIGRQEMDRSRPPPESGRDDLPAIDPGFRAPRDNHPVDVGEILRTVPATAAVKGLFLQSVLDRAPDRDAIFARAGVAPIRIVAFLDVEYETYLRLLVATAEAAHPGIPRALALRRFHHGFYETFADTLAGRVMFGVLGRDAEKVMPLGAQGYKVNVKLGEVRSYALSPRHVRYDFRDYPKAVCESCDVGVVEGALRFLGQPRARILVREDGADAMTIDAAW